MALGAIFLFVPGMTHIGLGLLLAGGVTALASNASFSPDGFISDIQSACGKVGEAFGTIVSAVQEAWGWITGFFSSMDQRATQIQADGSIYLQGFASGGFPEEGQLFLAREQGAEMVGSIGGRTAVATNNDIVTAVATGVADAVSSVMGNQSGQPVNVRVYLDSREIRAGQQRLARAMG